MRKYGWIILLVMCLLAGCGSKAAVAKKSEAPAVAQAEETAEMTAEEKEHATVEQVENQAVESIEAPETARMEDEQKTVDTSETAAEEMITYQQISQEEAKRIMEEEKGYIILDVRTYSEYNDGHIPGAICIPNESIGTEEIKKLPDKNQTILVYCRSGRRSKEASEKLAALGYKNILEIGGIIDWTGDVVTTLDEDTRTLRLLIDNREVPVTWEDNASVDEIKRLVSENEMDIAMSMYGGFEQVGPLGTGIVSDDAQTTTEAGDIVLYSSDQIVVFYGSNTWAYTRLGHVDLSAEEMAELFGGEDVTLTLRLS